MRAFGALAEASCFNVPAFIHHLTRSSPDPIRPLSPRTVRTTPPGKKALFCLWVRIRPMSIYSKVDRYHFLTLLCFHRSLEPFKNVTKSTPSARCTEIRLQHENNHHQKKHGVLCVQAKDIKLARRFQARGIRSSSSSLPMPAIDCRRSHCTMRIRALLIIPGTREENVQITF